MNYINQETAQLLIDSKIIEVGSDYIKLDNGALVYISQSAIEDLNVYAIKKY